jgi:hypothetical protein
MKASRPKAVAWYPVVEARMVVTSRSVLVGVAAALYVASLVLPTVAPFNPQFSNTVYPGWHAFQIGWRALGTVEPHEPDWWVVGAAWLVNPLVWIAGTATLIGRRGWARAAAFAGVGLCLPVLFRFGGIVAGLPGYWCWLASAALLAAGSSVRWEPQAPKQARHLTPAATSVSGNS